MRLLTQVDHPTGALRPRIVLRSAPVDPSPFFCYRSGRLHCEDVCLEELAERHGTPCYVYSESAIRAAYRSFRDAFASLDPLICYSVKANSNLSVLRILHEEGSGFDIVSGGELHRLMRIGADPQKVVFSGVGKTGEEIQKALEHSILSLQVESVSELEVIARLAEQRGIKAPISFRFNPDVAAKTHPYIATGRSGHKFGIGADQAVDEVLTILKRCPHLHAIGVGCHIGSQILDLSPFSRAFERILRLAERFRSHGHPIRHIDLGGGFGIPYRGEASLDLRPLAQRLQERRGDYRVLFEPGRILTARAGALLVRVLYRKVNYGRRFVVVDGGMNDLLRPALYDAYHRVAPLRERPDEIVADLVGPVCETGDFLARDRPLPDCQAGDFLAILDAGAYGFVLASNYNSRRRPAEVLVKGHSHRQIRRRETWDEIMQHEEPLRGKHEARNPKHETALRDRNSKHEIRNPKKR